MRWVAVGWFAAWALFSIPWGAAMSAPQWQRVRPPRVRASSRVRPDHVLNVLFYVPVAPIGVRLGWSLGTLVATGATLSATAEAIQLFSADRSPDGNDIIANVTGTALGAVMVGAWRRKRRS